MMLMMIVLKSGTWTQVRHFLELGLGLVTYGLGLDNFRISGLGLGERGLGLELGTMGLDYIFDF